MTTIGDEYLKKEVQCRCRYKDVSVDMNPGSNLPFNMDANVNDLSCNRDVNSAIRRDIARG